MDYSSLLSSLWMFTIAANTCAVLRLYRLSLSGFRYFFLYLVTQLAQTSLLFFIDIRSAAFFWTFLFSEPILWVLYVLVVKELYGLIFEQYQGIYTVSRWSMYAAWTLSLIISVLLLFATRNSRPADVGHLYYFQLTERVVVFSLALFLPMALFFLSRYPIQLHRNAVVHCLLYSVLFLTDALGLLLINFARLGVSRTANLLLVAVSGCCYLAWAVLLTREGEARNVVVHHRRNPAHEARLLEELYSMNQALLAVIRK